MVQLSKANPLLLVTCWIRQHVASESFTNGSHGRQWRGQTWLRHTFQKSLDIEVFGATKVLKVDNDQLNRIGQKDIFELESHNPWAAYQKGKSANHHCSWSRKSILGTCSYVENHPPHPPSPCNMIQYVIQYVILYILSWKHMQFSCQSGDLDGNGYLLPCPAAECCTWGTLDCILDGCDAVTLLHVLHRSVPCRFPPVEWYKGLGV